jgi:hypothetical protein
MLSRSGTAGRVRGYGCGFHATWWGTYREKALPKGELQGFDRTTEKRRPAKAAFYKSLRCIGLRIMFALARLLVNPLRNESCRVTNRCALA